MNARREWSPRRELLPDFASLKQNGTLYPMKATPLHATANAGAELPPFEKFETLARRLFAVPKKELDVKLAQYEKRKQKRRRALANPQG